MAVKVRQRPDRPGCWVFIDHKRMRKKKHFPDKETAVSFARKLRERLALGDFNLTEEEQELFPFRTYYKTWLETYAKANVKETTYTSYALAYRAHLLPFLGETDLRDITREQLKKFLYEKLSAGLARNTVKGYLAPLRAMFNHAIEDGYVNRNPCQGLMKSIRTEKGERMEKVSFLTRAEVAVLLETCQEHFSAHYPFVLLLVRTGLRLNEATALHWGDIDFNGRFIEVRRSYSPVTRKVHTPKSGKWRRVDMSLMLTESLSALHIQRKKTTLQKGWSPMPPWVFISEEGRIMDPDNFRSRIWTKLLAKAGLRHTRIHDLRHTFASLLIQNGESLAYVKEQMGHHSIQVTVDIYGHLVPGGNKAAVDRLDEPISANPVSAGPGRTLYAPTALLAQSAGQAENEKASDFSEAYVRATHRSRTDDLLITNQLLCQLS